MHDQRCRFYFRNRAIRGSWAQLKNSLTPIQQRHAHSKYLSELLGQAMVSTALMSHVLKFSGSLTLQARSDGPVTLIMAECTDSGHLRAIAHEQTPHKVTATTHLLNALPNGQLVMTIDAESQRYQGIVPLEHADLASCLEAYFQRSEQLPTRLYLFSYADQHAGLMLQILPDANPQQALDDLDHVAMMASTLKAEEICQLSPETLLHRLYHEDDIDLATPDPLQYRCRCSRERSLHALSSLGSEDLQHLLMEQHGQIQMDCELCGRTYRFEAEDLTAYLEPQAPLQ